MKRQTQHILIKITHQYKNISSRACWSPASGLKLLPTAERRGLTSAALQRSRVHRGGGAIKYIHQRLNHPEECWLQSSRHVLFLPSDRQSSLSRR